MALVVFVTTALNNTALAQTTSFNCPSASRCTSKDLEVVGATLVTSQCFCNPGSTTPITGTLTMTILNKTGSVRTSFAFFATLEKRVGNTVQTTELISRCSGPVAPNTTTTLTFGNISFSCGQNLRLTNVFLAWTDASDGDKNDCATILGNNCARITPKCGTDDEILITTPLSFTSTTDKACQGVSDGSVTVSPTGGTAPYSVTIAGQTFTNIPAGGSATKSGLAAGNIAVSCTDATAPTACTVSGTVALADEPCCVAPPKPAVCEIPASLCPSGGDGKATLRITNAVVGDVYSFTQGSTTTTKTATSSTLEFKGNPGQGFSVFGTNTVGTSTCTGATATCSDLSTTCASSNVTRAKIPQEEIQTIDAKIIGKEKTNVLAAPNPFSDRVRFTLHSDVSGQGSLELFNLMGQKVATVYQGHIEAGRVLNKEYSVPISRRSNLIYVFRVGEQKTTGKLLNW